MEDIQTHTDEDVIMTLLGVAYDAHAGSLHSNTGRNPIMVIHQSLFSNEEEAVMNGVEPGEFTRQVNAGFLPVFSTSMVTYDGLLSIYKKYGHLFRLNEYMVRHKIQRQYVNLLPDEILVLYFKVLPGEDTLLYTFITKREN